MTRPMSEEREKLEPCPFCGAPARVGQFFAPQSRDWRALCSNDQCEIGPYNDFNTEAEAIAAWNRRSTSASERRMRESLQAAIDRCQLYFDDYGEVRDCATQADIGDWLAALTSKGEG